MNKQLAKIVVTLCFALLLIVCHKAPAQAVSVPTIELGQVKTLGNEVQIPITLYRTNYLNSLSVTINIPENKGVSFKSFEPVGVFAGEEFSDSFNNRGSSLTIDFHSLSDKDFTLRNQPTTIGIITYALTSQFEEGDSIEIEVDQVRAKGRASADVLYSVLNGKIERRLPVGGVVTGTGPSAASALRILKHVDGTNPITEREMILSADVDADGKITQEDAQQILDYITGIKTSFLAIDTINMPNAAVKSDYYQVVTAKNGREPYEFRNVGSLPSGLKLDRATGEITGKPTRARDYTFSIQVTDALGNRATRAFAMSVIESNIQSVEEIPPVNVRLGYQPTLPSEVTVTYTDKTKGRERVYWEEVDTSQYGETMVTGEIGDTGFKISVKVSVVNTNYIQSVDIGYYQYLNFHTIKVNVNPEVYSVTINNLKTHYESNNTFSLASSSLKKGTTITIRVFDKYGNLLETKTQKIEIN